MLFLLNNPVIAVVFIISVGFSIVMIKKIVDEIRLNKGLQAKQLAMRVVKINKGLVRRVSALGAASLAPVAVFAVALVIGLNVTPDTTITDVVDIQSSADILNIFEDFNDKFDNNYYGRGWFGVDVALEEMAPTNDAVDFSNDAEADKGSDDHSEVNNQVEGVDEMDNVITDGLYIFSIYGNEVQVSKAWTQALGSDALELLHTFTYNNNYGCDETSFYPMGLYEDEDNLIVIGTSTTYVCVDPEDKENPDGTEPALYDYWWGYYDYQQETKVIVYSKTDFEVEDEYALKGNFIGTRKIGNDLFVVTSQYIPFNRYDTEAELDVEYYLPYYEVNEEQTVVEYKDIVYVDGTSPNAFTAFYAINLEEKEVDMEVILGDSGYNLYVSNNNMYLVGNIYYFWPAADLLEVEEPVYEQKTAIMRVAIADSSVEFDGIGYVDGYIENQFSMDEYQGHLRITTTVGWWGEGVVNYLWVLNDDMKVVGQVGGRDLPESKTLGEPGERIRSTRFDGDYAYVVTFLQTDPFYVINLSDPENPFIEGSLKITGFSEHLQVLDDNHVLGIGFETNENGGTIGLKFNIYDVSDKSNPIEAFEEPTVFLYEEYGYGWTSAIWNHKDLLVNLDKGIMSMPFSSHGWNETEDYWTYNSGILLFDLSIQEGIGEHDFIVHEENARFDCYVYKSLFIADQFYTISNKYIKVAPLDDPTNFTKSITLREFEYQTNPNEDPVEVDPDVLED